MQEFLLDGYSFEERDNLAGFLYVFRAAGPFRRPCRHQWNLSGPGFRVRVRVPHSFKRQDDDVAG